MNKAELLKQISNIELKNEIERRIKSGEWEIDTGYEDTYGDSSVRYISTLSFKNKVKEGGKAEWEYLALTDLLGEQDEKREKKEQEEIKKDNSRIEDWEKIEKLVSFDIENKGGWGNKNLIVKCRQCGSMNEHIYLHWSKWKETNDVRQSTVLSMIEYEWEAHLIQGHGNERKPWTEARQKFPKYDDWLKVKNEALWEARRNNRY